MSVLVDDLNRWRCEECDTPWFCVVITDAGATLRETAWQRALEHSIAQHEPMVRVRRVA